MKHPDDLEYIARRPGNPSTHSLGNGCSPHSNAAHNVLKLAKEWLEEGIEVVGVDITRLKVFILFSDNRSKQHLSEFDEKTQQKLAEHSIITEPVSRLDELILASKTEDA